MEILLQIIAYIIFVTVKIISANENLNFYFIFLFLIPPLIFLLDFSLTNNKIQSSLVFWLSTFWFLFFLKLNKQVDALSILLFLIFLYALYQGIALSETKKQSTSILFFSLSGLTILSFSILNPWGIYSCIISFAILIPSIKFKSGIKIKLFLFFCLFFIPVILTILVKRNSLNNFLISSWHAKWLSKEWMPNTVFELGYADLETAKRYIKRAKKIQINENLLNNKKISDNKSIYKLALPWIWYSPWLFFKGYIKLLLKNIFKSIFFILYTILTIISGFSIKFSQIPLTKLKKIVYKTSPFILFYFLFSGGYDVLPKLIVEPLVLINLINYVVLLKIIFLNKSNLKESKKNENFICTMAK